MTTKPPPAVLPADFKRSLQQPFVGECEMISWESASLMFDIDGDDPDVVIGKCELCEDVGAGDERRI
jgi:DNA primase catalytic subunit